MSGKCDFCSAPDPPWLYSAANFAMEQAAWGSSGGWGACDRCSELIEADNRRGLAERSVQSNPLVAALQPTPAERRQITAEVMALHDRFRQARRGPRRAFG